MLKFVEMIEREKKENWSATITIDGYSTAKTILGVMKDIEKEVNKIKSVSSQSDSYSCVSKKEVEEVLATCTIENSCGGFYVEMEDVGCATKYNEETNENEYSDANFYFCTRLVI